MLISIILLIIGFVILSKGADYFVDGAVALAQKYNVPSIIIGLTVVAMGTSAPEASVSINSALKGAAGVAIGNVIGSNIANIFLILGITSVICALTIQKNTIKYEIPFVGFITILLCLMGFYFHSVTRLCAAVFVLLFILFLFYLYKISKDSSDEEICDKKFSIFKIIIFIIGGLIALILGSDLTVNSAINIAHLLNISDRIIGLTIVSIGTSLPELITCIVAALKKQSDIAIGNIIGSNIFNILFVLGLTGLIIPVPFNNSFLFDGIISLAAAVILFIYTFKNKKLTRIQGVSFLVFYLLYLGYIILR